MRVTSVILILLALLVFLGAVAMDTSVPVPTETGRRVHNLGLMQQQQIAMLLAVGLFVGGAILFAFGGRKGIQDGEDEPCPYCAERIRVEAIKCRFCGADLSSLPAKQAAREKNGTCPSCRNTISLASQECPRCGVLFGPQSKFKVIPLPPIVR